jgi:hypothetical protein
VTRLLPALIAALLLVPAAAAAAPAPARSAHPVDLSHVEAPDRLPDLGAKPRLPDFLELSSRRGRARAAGSISPQTETRYRDQHGHQFFVGTDNPAVDLDPFANLLASTYHYDEIELVYVYVTSEAELTSICGASAAACYAPQPAGNGVMVVSYEDSDIAHGVIHEYGHHVDNNTYNLGGLSDCGIDGDGSRRWFFAREMEDRILDNLSCDPRANWGELLPEVFAEDYAQLVGIPEAEYHPAISVRPPTSRQKSALKDDLDSPFAPVAREISGRSSRRGRAARTVSFSIPVFVSARGAKGVRRIRLRGCSYEGFRNVFAGTCRLVVRAKKSRGRYSFRLVAY